jgi:hypothetical protein
MSRRVGIGLAVPVTAVIVTQAQLRTGSAL